MTKAQELYGKAQAIIDGTGPQGIRTSTPDRLRAHFTILRMNSNSGAGSMVLAQNQAAALAEISLALATLLDRTEK